MTFPGELSDPRAVPARLIMKHDYHSINQGWGRVMRQIFSADQEGARQVKEILATIKGTLVEMPLDFMKYDDIELVMWNPLTQIVAA